MSSPSALLLHMTWLVTPWAGRDFARSDAARCAHCITTWNDTTGLWVCPVGLCGIWSDDDDSKSFGAWSEVIFLHFFLENELLQQLPRRMLPAHL